MQFPHGDTNFSKGPSLVSLIFAEKVLVLYVKEHIYVIMHLRSEDLS